MRRPRCAVGPYGSSAPLVSSSGASPDGGVDDAPHCADALNDDAGACSLGDYVASVSGKRSAASPDEGSCSGIGGSSWNLVALLSAASSCVEGAFGPSDGARGSCAYRQGRPSGGSGAPSAWAGKVAAAARLAALRVAAPLRASTARLVMPAHLVRSVESAEPPARAGSAARMPAKRKFPIQVLRK
jgi:hypothetical protein